ncbi:MAG: ATP-binding protein, partial [Bacteroidota bacterium]
KPMTYQEGRYQDMRSGRNPKSQDSTDFTKAVLGSLAAHISVIDNNGHIIAINEAWKQFSKENGGRSLKNSTGVGSNYLETCKKSADRGDEQAKEAYDGIIRVLSGELLQFFMEYPCHTPTRKKWFMMRVTPLGGGHKGAVISHTDITERKLAEEQLQLHTKELERSNQALKDFAWIVSHDLQAPLRKVRHFISRVIQKEGNLLSEKFADYLNRAENSAESMQGFIEDVLAYSRASSQQLEFKQVDLNHTLNLVVSTLEIGIQEKNATVSWQNLPTIEADAGQMHQLFQNLVSNALKYCQKDIPPFIQLYATQEDEKVTLVVSDNGMGFPMEVAERLFEPFQRGNSHQQGYGIGLATCKRIIEHHNGQIWAVGKEQEGATFFIKLPLSHPHKDS